MNGFEKFSLTDFLLAPQLSGAPSEEHVKKWLEYKKTGSKIIDPDGTPEAFEFYEHLWKITDHTKKRKCNTGKVYTKEGVVEVSGDAMCSVWSTLRWGLKLFHPEELKETGLTRRGGYPASKSSLAAGKLLENFERFPLLKDPSVCAFVYNAYTRANLVIVPVGMNSDRGFRYWGKTQDYWDKTMEFVLSPEAECAGLSKYSKQFQRLLDHFTVNGLFLQSWIEKDDETNKYSPIMLTDKVEELSGKDPTKHKGWNEENWKKLVVEMTRRIEERREAMENAQQYFSGSVCLPARRSITV